MSVRGKRKLGIFVIVGIQILSHTFQICFFHAEFFCHETDDLTVINPAVQRFCNILRDFSSAAAVQSSNRYIDPVSGNCRCWHGLDLSRYRNVSFSGFSLDQFPHHLVIDFIQLIAGRDHKHHYPDCYRNIQIKTFDHTDSFCRLLCCGCLGAIKICSGKDSTHDSGSQSGTGFLAHAHR